MRLFYIGNGFDKSHCLQTDYYDFKEFLKVNNFSLYQELRELYHLYDHELACIDFPPYEHKNDRKTDKDIEEEKNFNFWSKFENKLSHIDELHIDTSLGMISAQFRDIEDYDISWRQSILYKNLDIYKDLQNEFLTYCRAKLSNMYYFKTVKNVKNL